MYQSMNSLELRRESAQPASESAIPTEIVFVRVNHKNELYFSMISFQNEANRVYLPEINIVIFKRQC